LFEGRRDIANHHQHFWFTLYPAAGPAALQGIIVSWSTSIIDPNYLEGAHLSNDTFNVTLELVAAHESHHTSNITEKDLP
jgi:hypothetical protein